MRRLRIYAAALLVAVTASALRTRIVGGMNRLGAHFTDLPQA